MSRYRFARISDRLTFRVTRFARSGPEFLERLPLVPRIYDALIAANERVVPDEEFVVSGSDIDMRLNPSDSQFAREFYESKTNVNEADFDRLFRELCFDGMTYVDVGAHLGYYPLLADAVCDPGRLVAFEAERRNADLLEENARLNDAAIQVDRRAVSDHTGTEEWDASESLESGSIATADDSTGAHRTVETVRLDEFLDDGRIDRVDLLKIDVEGAEGLVLDGLAEAISRVDGIAVELHTQRTPEFGHDPGEILHRLLEVGDPIYHLDNNGTVDAITRERLESMDVPSALEMTPTTVHTLVAIRAGSRLSEQIPPDLATLVGE